MQLTIGKSFFNYDAYVKRLAAGEMRHVMLNDAAHCNWKQD
jgi:hypothetical protein